MTRREHSADVVWYRDIWQVCAKAKAAVLAQSSTAGEGGRPLRLDNCEAKDVTALFATTVFIDLLPRGFADQDALRKLCKQHGKVCARQQQALPPLSPRRCYPLGVSRCAEPEHVQRVLTSGPSPRIARPALPTAAPAQKQCTWSPGGGTGGACTTCGLASARGMVGACGGGVGAGGTPRMGRLAALSPPM
eukprot:1187598-Prorocentrum_minimum.AAC.4